MAERIYSDAEVNGMLAGRERANAAHPLATTGTCRNCHLPIVFQPYFLDGKQPNPPVWFHRPGSTTCASEPDGWTGERWPQAEPEEADRNV